MLLIILSLIGIITRGESNGDVCDAREIPAGTNSTGHVITATFPSSEVGRVVQSLETCLLKGTGVEAPLAVLHCQQFRSQWVTHNVWNMSVSECASFDNLGIDQNITAISDIITQSTLPALLDRNSTTSREMELTKQPLDPIGGHNRSEYGNDFTTQPAPASLADKSDVPPQQKFVNAPDTLAARIATAKLRVDVPGNLSAQDHQNLVQYVGETSKLMTPSQRIPVNVSKDAVKVIEELTKKAEEVASDEEAHVKCNCSEYETRGDLVGALKSFVDHVDVKDEGLYVDTPHFTIATENTPRVYGGRKPRTRNSGITYSVKGAVFRSAVAIDNYDLDKGTDENRAGMSSNSSGHRHYERMALTTFTVPWSVLNELSAKDEDENGVRLSFILFKNSFLFPSEEYKSNQVISASIDGVESLDNLSQPIVFTMDTNLDLLGIEKKDFRYVCGYWNFTLRAWSSKGCRLTNPGPPPQCQCNHMTHFAILMDIHSDHQHSHTRENLLNGITNWGCALSIAGLVLTISVHAAYKQLHSKRPQIILMHLSSVMLVSYIVFLCGVNATEKPNVCMAVAAVLHYLWLCVWCWMAVEGQTMYSLLVQVIGSTAPHYMARACCFAYGVPLLVIVTCIGVAINLKNHFEHHVGSDDSSKAMKESVRTSYVGESACWPAGNFLYFGFLLPIGIMLIFNFIIFGFVLRILMRGKTEVQSTAKKRSTKQLAGSVVSVTSLLGTTWLFGFLSMTSKESSYRFVTQLIFSLLNSLQGFMLFILFCVNHKLVRKVCLESIRRKFPRSPTQFASGSARTSLKLQPNNQQMNRHPRSNTGSFRGYLGTTFAPVSGEALAQALRCKGVAQRNRHGDNTWSS